MTDLRLKGGRELQQMLDQFPVKIAKNVMRGALRAGANVIRDEARSRIYSVSGKLAKAVKTDTLTDGMQVTARVKLRGEHSFVGLFLEYGVAPHLINKGDAALTLRSLNKRAKKSGVLRREKNGLVRVGGYDYMVGPRGARSGAEDEVLKIGDAFIGGAILHPGFSPKPFLRPALDARASDAVRAVGDYIGARINGGSIDAPVLEVEE